MTRRYYVAEPITGSSAVLSGGEAHHLMHVMRAEVGDTVVLFDGSGCEFPARVDVIGRREVELAVIDRVEVDRELPISLMLAVSLPKGDRQRWLIEKAVELGVSRLVPLVTERSVVQPSDQVRARLRKTVIEASKQCGRNRLMEVAEPVNWSDLLGAMIQDHALIERLKQVDVLMIDELGKEEVKSNFPASTLDYIFRHRVSRRKTVLMASNLEIDKFDLKYGTGIKSLLERKVMILPMRGPDWNAVK